MTREVQQQLNELLCSSSDFNSLTVKRFRTLAHAAKRAIAQNVLLTVENTCLSMQNQERTHQRVTGNHLLGWARLMTRGDIAHARRVKGQRSLLALSSPPPLLLTERLESPTNNPNLSVDNEDTSTFAVEYLEMDGDEYS